MANTCSLYNRFVLYFGPQLMRFDNGIYRGRVTVVNMDHWLTGKKPEVFFY